MGVVMDGRFIMGVVVGVAAVYGWHMWQAKKATG